MPPPLLLLLLSCACVSWSLLFTPSNVVVVSSGVPCSLAPSFCIRSIALLDHRIHRHDRRHLLGGDRGGLRPLQLLPVADLEVGEFFHLRNLRAEPHVVRHHDAAALFERLALLAHRDRDHGLVRVVAGDLLFLARLLDVEVDIQFLGRLLLRLLLWLVLRLFLAAMSFLAFSRVLPCAAASRRRS